MASLLSSVYHSKLLFYREELKKSDNRIRKLVWGRIAVALLFLVFVFLGFDNALFFYGLPLLAIVFLYLVSRYGKQSEKQGLISRLVKLNELELAALDNKVEGFPSGNQFKDEHHPFSYDLDLFGDGSLFQYLNRCASDLGEEQMAKDLLHPSYSLQEVTARQEAVKELGSRLDLRQQLWAVGKGVQAEVASREHLKEWLNEKSWIKGVLTFTLIRWGMPAIALGCIGLSFINSAFMSLFLVVFTVQWSIISMYSSRITKTLLTLSRYRQWLENYGKLLNEFRQVDFQSPLLRYHHEQALEAHAEVRRFSRLVNALEARLNPLANAFGNGVFSLDLHSMVALEKWRSKNGLALPRWLQSLAEWDALNSLAHFRYSHPAYAFPQLEEQLELKTENLGHPLIPDSYRVNNRCAMPKAPHVKIITGANMAGKSTFLRAVGINFVLSQMGSVVCASAWSGPLAALRSGMRTTDSLQDHQSYFFAELKRLKSIVEELKAGTKMLVLLDEILKGTNSDDKQAGSRELILQLTALPALVFLATHDVVLGELAKEHPTRITAACFESQIKEGQLHFDYQLKEGVAQTRNATFLMRKMGIIPG